jgi:hypothetical protein
LVVVVAVVLVVLEFLAQVQILAWVVTDYQVPLVVLQ